MDKYYFVAIMLYALQRDLIDYPVTSVLNLIDLERMELSREDFLCIVYSDAMTEHFQYGVSFGVYDKYLESEIFSDPALPF